MGNQIDYCLWIWWVPAFQSSSSRRLAYWYHHPMLKIAWHNTQLCVPFWIWNYQIFGLIMTLYLFDFTSQRSMFNRCHNLTFYYAFVLSPAGVYRKNLLVLRTVFLRQKSLITMFCLWHPSHLDPFSWPLLSQNSTLMAPCTARFTLNLFSVTGQQDQVAWHITSSSTFSEVHTSYCIGMLFKTSQPDHLERISPGSELF